MQAIRHGPLAALALLLAGSLAFAWSPGGDPAARLAELQEKRKTAQAEFEARMDAEKDEATQMKLWGARPGKEFLPQFKAVAIEAKGTPTAVTAWLVVVELAGEWGDGEAAKQAVDTLVTDHVTAPEMDQLSNGLGRVSRFVGTEKVLDTQRTLAEKSQHKNVQAAALYNLAFILNEGTTPEEKGEARETFERIIKDFPGVKPKRGASYADRAKGILFELDHLQIGMVAPDVQAIDENGQKFSTADYRGKVVVLDFWGNW